jgi:hypothetical protein
MLSDSDIHGLSNHHPRTAALAAHMQRADGISAQPARLANNRHPAMGACVFTRLADKMAKQTIPLLLLCNPKLRY